MTEVFADDTGRYRLDSRIATGGMGVVWRGTDTVLNRVVAIKILKGEYADDATFRSRFETEARHAAALHHPGVAAVFDSGQGQASDGGGPRPFLVMEFVDGQPLSNLLRPNAPLDPAVARTLIADAADAIGAAHAAGIVHRDVKPANLLVTPDRQIKITDFGIARAADGIALTATGQVMGTPQYLSPEQAEGSTATPASDIYSLGVVLFECLAGYRPFGGDTPITTALAHLRDPIPDLPDFVPADLAAVVRRALAKKPSERFATAADFAAALRNPTGGIAAPVVAPTPPGEADSTWMLPSVGSTQTPAPTPPPTPTSTSTPTSSANQPPRSPAWLWILLAVLVIAAVAVLLITQLNNSSDDPDTQETATSGSTPTEETSAPSSSTTSAATVNIDADDYIGRNVDEVARELRDLGLRVSTRRVDNPGDEEADTVENVSPDGELEERDKVTVTYWGTPPESSPPTTEPTSPPTSEDTTPPTTDPTSDTTTAADDSSSKSTEKPVEELRAPGRATRDD